jgi:hypothetical protein
MSWIKRIVARGRMYRDLSEEIRQHLDEKIDVLMATGLSREQAAAVARREFGNVAALEERGREAWQWPSIESLIFDIRYALRQLRPPAIVHRRRRARAGARDRRQHRGVQRD